jgi:hypothetical protein
MLVFPFVETLEMIAAVVVMTVSSACCPVGRALEVETQPFAQHWRCWRRNGYDAFLVRSQMVQLDGTHDTLDVENLAVDVGFGRWTHGNRG